MRVGENRNMKTKIIFIVAILLASATGAFAQNGGKAEPLRVKFAKGKTSAVLSGTLKQNREMEYVFGAKKNQNVRAVIASTAPKGKFHAFKIVGADGVNYLAEYDLNYELEFDAPQTGDYIIYVQFRATDKVRSGKFSLTLTVR